MEPTNIADDLSVSSRAGNPLPLEMQRQQMSNWDWAAVCSSVNNYYFGGNDRDNTQDKLVGKAFLGVCSINPHNPACDRPNSMESGLILTNRYNATIKGALPLKTIESEIDAGRPIVAGIASSRGGMAFMLVIIGYDKSGNIVIKSPHIGDEARVASLAGFPSNLFPGCEWRSSCTTHNQEKDASISNFNAPKGLA